MGENETFREKFLKELVKNFTNTDIKMLNYMLPQIEKRIISNKKKQDAI